MVQIFLSYAREDEKQVKKLYQRLFDAGFKPWMDKKDLLPGERWKSRIPRAIRQSDFFLACLSTCSVTKRGFLQKEINDALDIWQEKLDSDIYLIPVRLEDCEVPERLCDFQWVDLFEEDGWIRLVKAIQVGMERRAPAAEPAVRQSISSPESGTQEDQGLITKAQTPAIKDEPLTSVAEGMSPDEQVTMPIALLKVRCAQQHIFHPIREAITVIGRVKDCQLEIPDDYDNVERHHATIFYKEAVFTLSDGYQNRPTRFGTFVNGVKVKPQTRMPLRHWDRIVLGGFRKKEAHQLSRGACEIVFEIGS
jgi:pSer/pThr/pTyr-binding forkhead associated (FHA) protein